MKLKVLWTGSSHCEDMDSKMLEEKCIGAIIGIGSLEIVQYILYIMLLRLMHAIKQTLMINKIKSLGKTSFHASFNHSHISIIDTHIQ